MTKKTVPSSMSYHCTVKSRTIDGVEYVERGAVDRAQAALFKASETISYIKDRWFLSLDKRATEQEARARHLSVIERLNKTISEKDAIIYDLQNQLVEQAADYEDVVTDGASAWDISETIMETERLRLCKKCTYSKYSDTFKALACSHLTADNITCLQSRLDTVIDGIKMCGPEAIHFVPRIIAKYAKPVPAFE